MTGNINQDISQCFLFNIQYSIWVNLKRNSNNRFGPGNQKWQTAQRKQVSSFAKLSFYCNWWQASGGTHYATHSSYKSVRLGMVQPLYCKIVTLTRPSERKIWPCLGIILSSKLQAHKNGIDRVDNEPTFVANNEQASKCPTKVHATISQYN